MRYLLIPLLFVSCGYHKSELKHENGKVIGKQYFPDTRQNVTGVGFSSGGHTVITTHSVGQDEKYIVIFKCSHGVVFSINRSDIYGKLDEGDTVIIDYYELLNDSNEIKDLDFVNATELK